MAARALSSSCAFSTGACGDRALGLRRQRTPTLSTQVSHRCACASLHGGALPSPSSRPCGTPSDLERARAFPGALPPSSISPALGRLSRRRISHVSRLSGGGGDGDGTGGGNGGGGGGGDGEQGSEEGDDAKSRNKAEALATLAALGKSVEALPPDVAQALDAGKITGPILQRWAELAQSPLFAALLRFQGFKERLLADDLFLTKVGIECGVGLFTKSAAEYSKRQDKFFAEIDFVIADVIMALIADFMLTWLPAPTVNLSPALNAAAGPVAKFLASCPDNAFQVAIRGTSYSLAQRFGAIARNGAKLVAVGTGASLAGTAATNGLIWLRKRSAPKSEGVGGGAGAEGEAEAEIPILRTSLAYGVYMGVSSNLRYQVLAGVVEQRLLEPLLEKNKLALSTLSFIARTANTFLGSLLWVDYARWVGVQSAH